MLNIIKIDLVKMTGEQATRQGLQSCHPKTDRETTPAEKYTRDTLARHVFAELFKKEGTKEQRDPLQADTIARALIDGGAVVGSLLWVRYSVGEEVDTLPDGFRPSAFGWVRGCDLPILFVEKEEEERAYLVRFTW